MKPRTIIGLAVIAVLAVAVAYRYSQTEATIERCYRECGLCGLRRGEVAVMIQNILTSPLTREQQIERYESTGEPGDGKAACMPCVIAVLDLTDLMREDLR